MCYLIDSIYNLFVNNTFVNIIYLLTNITYVLGYIFYIKECRNVQNEFEYLEQKNDTDNFEYLELENSIDDYKPKTKAKNPYVRSSILFTITYVIYLIGSVYAIFYNFTFDNISTLLAYLLYTVAYIYYTKECNDQENNILQKATPYITRYTMKNNSLIV